MLWCPAIFTSSILSTPIVFKNALLALCPLVLFILFRSRVLSVWAINCSLVSRLMKLLYLHISN